MKKNPVDIQGKNTGKQFSDETGELREGRAQGQPSYTNQPENSKKNKEGHPEEQKITGDQSKETSRGSDQNSDKNVRRNGSSL